MRVARLVIASMLLVLVFCTSSLATEKSPSRGFAKQTNSELLLPADYRNWVVLAPNTSGLPTHSHKNVASKLYVEPSSYEEFAQTGTWPNKTVIVMELLANKPVPKGACNVMGLEAAVKDDSGFPELWSYYGIVYTGTTEQRKVAQVSCVDCENPMDSMLTMAFPTLRAVINAKPGHITPSLF